jgi:outer membrane protein TolC
LDLEIPIHLWGQGRYTHELDLLQARIALDKARMDYKEAQEDLRTTVLNKVRNLRHAAKKVELSRKSTELSRKNYQMDEVKLRLGRITNNEFIDTQERLSQAKQDEVQAVIGYIDRINGLDSFLGTLLKTYGIEFQESRPGQEEKYLPGKTWMLDHRD